MGYFDAHGEYHPEKGERMRRKHAGTISIFEREASVNGAPVWVCSVMINGRRAVEIGYPRQYEPLGLPSDPLEQQGV